MYCVFTLSVTVQGGGDGAEEKKDEEQEEQEEEDDFLTQMQYNQTQTLLGFIKHKDSDFFWER